MLCQKISPIELLRLGDCGAACYEHCLEGSTRPYSPQLLRAECAQAKSSFVAKVIASSLRKGNIVEDDEGRLYVVLNAENFHPGKGTPVTQVEMRRISDGVKVNERYKTTDTLERAYVESKPFNYLYQDGNSYVFMDPVSFEQLSLPAEMIGEQAVYLAENMEVQISLHNGVPISIELPQRVVLEVIDTEPVVKGQTASSSFKPASLSNGVRTMVPPHVTAGTRIVVMTDDGSYVERAKD
jgi:elongation factor P